MCALSNSGDESRCIVFLGSRGYTGSHFLNYLRSRNFKVLDFARDRPLFSPTWILAIVLNDSTNIYWFASKVNPIIAESSPELVDQ